MNRRSIISIALLYLICLFLVLWRLYFLFVVDEGTVFGDITNHYFRAGQVILAGQNPYESHFINHPPLMLLLFATLVWIHPAPYSIALFILGLYLLVPILTYYASTPYLSGTRSLIATWFVALNPLTLYSGVFMLDDDLLIMLMILVFLILYPRYPRTALILAGIFGGFKFIPLAIGVFIVINDNELSTVRKIQATFLGCIAFLCSISVGVSLWGFATFYRIANYISIVSVDYPSMSLFYIISYYLNVSADTILRLLAICSAAIVVIVTIAIGRNSHNSMVDNLPYLIALALFAIYLGNATTNYTYFTWIVPFLTIIGLRWKDDKQSYVVPSLLLLVIGLGYFSSEWANFTWAYGEQGIILANFGTVSVWIVLFLFLILIFIEIRKKE